MASLLVQAVPAQAASTALSYSNRLVAVDSKGLASIKIGCKTKGRCTGSVGVNGSKRIATKYSVAGRTTKWITVRVSATDPKNPQISNGNTLGRRSGNLLFNEFTPKKHSILVPVTLERRVKSQMIRGNVRGTAAGSPSKVTLELLPASKSGTTGQRARTLTPNSSSDDFAFSVSLGRNNAPSRPYILRVSGEVNGEKRTWYWRGFDGVARGGGRYAGEANWIRARASSTYDAYVRYGAIRGKVTNGSGSVSGAGVVVVAPPVKFPSDVRSRRSLDIQSCGNVMGTGRSSSNGDYTVGFLPQDKYTTDKRFAVQVVDGNASTVNRWNDKWSSCYQATSYLKGRDRLVALPRTGAAPVTTLDAHMRASSAKVRFDLSYGSYSKTTQDRFVTLREAIPSKAIRDVPITKSAYVSKSGDLTLSNVPSGTYWVEMARRTSCSAWYSSVYADNKLYLKGLERASERWKTVAGKYPEYKKSYTMGYKAKTPPKGKKGWMYRDYCRSNSAGTYTKVAVVEGKTAVVKRSVRRGGTISGHITRSGGRSNKEIMVTAYSKKGGKLVQRSAITNGGGNFTIFGLASGTYSIAVNPDSWRGIDRSFNGRHSKKVRAGGNYSVGRLFLK
ncbi:carboxypeptidase-like regulatory domain-containing protein [Aeromicrobium sp. Root495]|uniref:carboxypeptidase-like regulatory domain-containing protein n=1 Tax=Aeromicrobium sp. Root495 TaxID=1736550 RepID=UPI0012E88C19|nr:carboxypeptidase-like regulatory domain-containing protein [Aeromicrobium sp. Root495]